MATTTAHEYEPRGENRLLAVLPSDVRARVARDLDPVRVGFKELVYESDEPAMYVYFPLDGVFSVLTVVPDGQLVEVATVGNEGFLGLPVLLGGDASPSRIFCQIPGEALRARASVFREHLDREPPLRNLLLRYTQAYLTLVSQSAACNRAHAVHERLARWLLATQDRVARDEFPLTQEFMGLMLGVSRARVNVAAGMLQHAGFISYRRGHITVTDRSGLEAAACTCYRIVRREFDRLLK